MHTHLHQRIEIHKRNFILTMRLFPFLQCMNRPHLKLLHVPLKHNVLVQIQCILLSKFNLSRIRTNRYSVRPNIKNIEPSYRTRTKLNQWNSFCTKCLLPIFTGRDWKIGRVIFCPIPFFYRALINHSNYDHSICKAMGISCTIWPIKKFFLPTITPAR